MECDPSIKAIILKIDQDKHNYIVEDLDDQTLVVKESQLHNLKGKLEEVVIHRLDFIASRLTIVYNRSLQTHSRCPITLTLINRHKLCLRVDFTVVRETVRAPSLPLVDHILQKNPAEVRLKCS